MEVAILMSMVFIVLLRSMDHSRYWWESRALSTPSRRTVAVAGDPSTRNACSFFIYQMNSEMKNRAFYSANTD